EVPRAEHRELLRRALEAADHLSGRDAGREWRGQERARGKAYVDVEIRRLAVDEEIVESFQAADLERAARDGAAGQHQRDLCIWLADRKVALLDYGDPHRGASRMSLTHARERRVSRRGSRVRGNHL